MTPTEAKAEIFLTAFMRSKQAEQEAFGGDLIDLVIAEMRKEEKSRPFNRFIAEIKPKRHK